MSRSVISRVLKHKLLLIKESFYKHIERLKIIFARLRAAGLKCNAHKCSFSLNYIPYLGYVITRGGIRPGINKLQCMMDLVRTITTAKAQVLIGMFQYYSDICTRRYHVLATLVEADNFPKGRKILWNCALEDSFK